MKMPALPHTTGIALFSCLSRIFLVFSRKTDGRQHMFWRRPALTGFLIGVTVMAGGAQSKTWTPPKTPWGDPDLQGIWPGNVGVPMQRPADLGERTTLTEAEFAQKEAQAKRQADADNQAFTTSDTRPGIGPPSYWNRCALSRAPGGSEGPTDESGSVRRACGAATIRFFIPSSGS